MKIVWKIMMLQVMMLMTVLALLGCQRATIIEDSIDEIFDSLKEAALVTKASGGVGYVFSRLRSTGENIKSLGRPSSGPIPFMHIFDSMLDGIQQGGVRRGAGFRGGDGAPAGG